MNQKLDHILSEIKTKQKNWDAAASDLLRSQTKLEFNAPPSFHCRIRISDGGSEFYFEGTLRPDAIADLIIWLKGFQE
jgi:hypothetical protein